MKNIILIFTLSILLASCGAPIDQHFDPENYETELKEMQNDKEITFEEYMTINMFIGAASVTGEDLSQHTYRELLERGKKMREDFNKDLPNMQGL